MKKGLLLAAALSLVTVLGCGGGGSATGAGHVVIGYVVDDATLQPIGGAKVVLGSLPAVLSRDADGMFRIEFAPVGLTTLTVSKSGYNTRVANVTVLDQPVTDLSLIRLVRTGGDGGGGGGDLPPPPPF